MALRGAAESGAPVESGLRLFLQPLAPARAHLAVRIAWLVALAGVGVGLGASVVRALKNEGFSQMAFPWSQMATYLVLAALVGGMLAVAGASYQGVFRNPLADPYLLGAAAGAGLGATMAVVYGPGGGLADDLLPIAAFTGAAIAVAKARAGTTATRAVQEGVQMHGGMGMTDQFDIGFFMKRARVCQELFGDANFHADQLARLKSY